MKTSIESLPIELWVDIFSYLEAHHLLHAFTNLNHHIDRILASDYILFHAHFDKCNRNPLDYTHQPYWPEPILHRIVSLRPVDPHKPSHLPEFLRWYFAQLTQLKSLAVKLRGREIPPMSDVLPRLDSLRYLAIDCVPTQLLLDAILAAPNVRAGRFEFSSPTRSIHMDSSNISPMEVLDIQLEDTSRGSVMNLLLSHMPRLQRLRMKNTDTYVNNREWLFFETLFTLPELHTIDIRCRSSFATPVVFQSLRHNLPAVQSASVHIDFDFIDDDVVNHLIHHWWPVFESIDRVKITIRCRNQFLRINGTMQANLNSLRAVLLAMNHQYDGSVTTTTWSDKFHLDSQIMEISVCKLR